MKIRLRTVLGASLIVPVFVFSNVIVLAHEADTPHEEKNTGMSQTAALTADGETVSSSPEEVKRRVAERKEVLKTRLSTVKQARLKNRCKASQGKLGSLQGRITGLETSRAQVYQNLNNRLTRLSEQLTTHNVDVTQLNSQINELTALTETFAADLSAYKTVVADLAAMDCASDPEGFQASLESAREARAKAAESAKAVHMYLTDTIKPTLKELRAQFAQNSGEGTGEESVPTAENDGGEN